VSYKKFHLKKIKKASLLTGILLLTGAFFLYFYVPLLVIEIKNPLIDLARTYVLKEKPVELKNQKQFTEIHWKGTGKIDLTANLYLTSATRAKATVILVHGIRSQKEVWHPTAVWLQQNGYNAVAIDLRAHGQSQGRYCTYGYYEKKDIRNLLNVLSNKYQINTPFGIWGHSLGGAISLQALAIEPRLEFGIIESAYADFEQITEDYSEYYLSFHFAPLNEFVVERAAEIASFNPEEINPEDNCRKIKQPVLLIHGKADAKINYQNALKNFKALQSDNKQLILIENAHHTDIEQKGGEKLKKQILKFIDENIDSKTISYLDQNSGHTGYSNLK